MVRRAARSSNISNNEISSDKDQDAATESPAEITRCICGNEEFVSTARTKSLNAIPGLYVQCERCNVWQHGFCMGFLAEKDIPNEYYCEKCEPSFHRISHKHGMLLSKYEPPKGTKDPQAKAQAKPLKESIQDGPTKHKSTGFAPKRKTDADLKETKGNTQDDEVPEDTKMEPRDFSNESASEKGASEPVVIVSGASKSLDSAESASHEPPLNALSGGSSGSSTNKPLNNEDTTNIKKEDDERAEEHRPSKTKPERSVAVDDSFDDKSSQDNKENVQSDAKKKPRRKLSESEAVNPSRNRKWRSREDEILQRVLEESAREAREAEARRRSLEGLSPLESEGQSATDAQFENQNDEENGDSNDDRPTRSSRARNSPTPTTENRRKETVRNGISGRAPRGGRTSRGGRRGGARQSTYNSEAGAQAPKSPTNTRRTANGVKKCKPRIPSQRSTIEEMRRRVASLLEFSSRTQDELANEKENRLKLLEKNAHNGQFDSSFEYLSNLSDQNRESLENLTRKLLKWEEQFGVKDSP